MSKNNLIRRAINKYHVFPKFRRDREKSFKDFMDYFNFDIEEYNIVTEEIINDREFNELVNIEFSKADLNNSFPFEKICWPYFVYFLVRKTKPETIVETGVWYGVSSSIILNALKRNDKGTLYSIDLPAYYETGGYTDENPYLNINDRTSSLPPSRSPGFIIPATLKRRWKLILGDSKIHLPQVFNEIKSTDIFLHDSLHSYENMMFEFNLALKNVKPGGFIMSDNIDWHDAYVDFCKEKKLKNKTFLAYFETPKLKHNFGAILL